MEGKSSRPIKKSRASNEVQWLKDIEGHLSKKIYSRMPYPLFPGPRKFSKLSWLSKLTSNITIGMRAVILKWHLQGLVVHAKHYNQVHMDWAAMGALVEIWHPQIHTFIFPTFEASILLEEVELLLGLKKLKKDGKMNIMHMLKKVTSKEVLGSFMSSEAIKAVQTQKGVNLQKLAEWVINALERPTGDDDYIEGIMKGFVICLAGALLFPYADSIVEKDQLSAICGIWEGKRVGPAVLAYLYSGLTTSSMANVLGFSGNVVNRVPWAKKRKDWCEHFSTMPQYMFICAPSCLIPHELLTRPSPDMELQLIGATKFVLYNAHWCYTQIGLPRHSFLTLPNLPSIKKREVGTESDSKNVKAIKAPWKASIALQTVESLNEDRELLEAYVTEIRKLRPEVPKPLM